MNLKNRKLLVAAILTVSAITVFAKVVDIASQDELNALTTNNNHVIIKYYAPWCGACQFTDKPYKELSDELAQEEKFSQIAFAQANVDNMAQDFLKKEGIEGIPTFKYLEGGKEKDAVVGVESMQKFKETIKDHAEKAFSGAQKKKNKKRSPGLIGGIKDFFMAVVAKVAAFIKFIIAQIKGIFGR